MEIRYIRASDDRKAISRIYEQSWRYAYRGIVPQDYLDAIPEGRWVKNQDIPGWHTMICMEDGIYVGTSSFSRSRLEQYGDSGEVISLYLLPEYMGKGYGRQLFGAVLEEFNKQGYSEVYLWVLEENLPARRFYETAGFSCTDDRMTSLIGGKKLQEIRYIYRFARELSPGA